MKMIHLVTACSLVLGTSALAHEAQYDTPPVDDHASGGAVPSEPPYPGPEWTHRQTLSIGLGAGILARMGKDAFYWKSIWTWQACEPKAPEVTDHHGGTCKWEVAVATNYNLHVCPDGAPIVSRSGYGVTLKSKVEGDYWEFTEAVTCGAYPVAAKADQKEKPLQLKNIIKSFPE